MSIDLEKTEEFLVKKYHGEFLNIEKDCLEDEIRIGVCVDVETTGLSTDSDEITEIGMSKFNFNPKTGCIFELKDFYHSFNQPKKLISEKITKLTGITNDMVEGKKINWEETDLFFKEEIGRAHV